MNALGLTGTQWFIVILVGMLVLGSVLHAVAVSLKGFKTVNKYHYITFVDENGEKKTHSVGSVDFQKAMDHTKPSPGSLFRK
jgi:hypothetical protein